MKVTKAKPALFRLSKACDVWLRNEARIQGKTMTRILEELAAPYMEANERRKMAAKLTSQS